MPSDPNDDKPSDGDDADKANPQAAAPQVKAKESELTDMAKGIAMTWPLWAMSGILAWLWWWGWF
jgi:hypothetical protein